MNPVAVVLAVPLPHDALACRALTRVDYADAFGVRVDAPERGLPERYARAMFENAPRWVKILTHLRDSIVSVAGLKTAADLIRESLEIGKPDGRLGAKLPLTVLQRTSDALLFGENDRHLDFRVSVERTGMAGELCVVTAVKLNNWMGHVYFLPVRPLHRIVVPAMMQQAARSLALASLPAR